MRITITLPSGKIKKEIPTNWDDINYRQFLDINKNGWTILLTPSELIAYFTGIDVEVIRKSKIEGLETVIKLLSFLQLVPMKFEIPKRLFVSGQSPNGFWYDIPKNLEFESTGQFTDLESEAAKLSPNPEDKLSNLEHYPLIVATYCVDPYSWQEAEKLAPFIFNSPCQEVLAIGNFTLVKLIELNLNIKPTSPPVVTRLSKFQLALKGWQKNMVSSARFYLWRRRLGRAGMNF